MADCVAKVFFAFGRETLIQDRARTSNNDSKEPTLRFDCYKFLFHRACLATFATQSANTGLCVLVIAHRCAHALSKFALDTNSGGIEHEENSFCCCSSYDGLGTSSRGAMSPSYADGHPGRPTCLQRLGRPRNAGALWRR